MDLPKAIFCWSGGKDSAYCLHKVLSEKLFDVKYLLTTVNDEFKRVSMHGTREELLDLQTASVGIPSLKVRVKEGTNNEYEKQMEAVLLKAKAEGIEHVIFGDIFLEDLRVYREANLAKVNMKAVFPLWKKDTTEIINHFIALKFKTVLCCVNDGYLNEEWLGREIDENFLKELPDNVDACGENGEYHTFCYAGPIFKKEINISIGEKIYKPLEIKLNDDCKTDTKVVTKGFWFCDLVPILTT
ncbi:MAG: diphthine--ammonia ligase [Bacteroidetes bacterium]|nr:diphthine--ammonia ligase [Bacteroidota bacterium]